MRDYTDIIDILLDKDNHEPIVLMDASGKEVAFQQVALVPYTTGGKDGLYVLLSPIEKIEGISEDAAIVFYVDTDGSGKSVLRAVDNDEVINAVFERYSQILEANGINV